MIADDGELGLTYEQLTFVLQHGIPLNRLFDATGLIPAQYKQIMGDLGLLVAYGTTPCKAAGHTLRSRHGYCLQCDTAKVAYALRGSTDGWLYLASSEELGALKIGVASDAEERITGLRRQNYGGADDWEKMLAVWVKEAGRVEARAHKKLAAYAIDGESIREGRLVFCRELFACDLLHAVDAISEAMHD